MNCDNREFMFSRDFVRCVIRSLKPRWLEPPDFRYGERRGSPFSPAFQGAVEFIAVDERGMFLDDVELKFLYRPLTMATFKAVFEEKISDEKLRESICKQLSFFFFVSFAAHYFYENGEPENYATAAANFIAGFIFSLRKTDFFDDSIWIEYEENIVEMATILKNDSNV